MLVLASSDVRRFLEAREVWRIGPTMRLGYVRTAAVLNCANQKPRPRLPAPRMQEIRMDIMAARDLGDVRLGRQRLLDQPQLLSLSPPPPPLRAG